MMIDVINVIGALNDTYVNNPAPGKSLNRSLNK